jgi:tetratricopeptide (TPR) repeat protein
MHRTIRIIARTVLAALVCSAVSLHAAEGKRVALIIGNDAYSGRPLKNAVNDARIMDKALRGAGFKTILRENAKKADIEEAVTEFVDQLGPDDTALFYYAGHGVQIASENFLVPVDFEAASSVSLAKFRCFSFAAIIDLVKHSRAKKTIFILDACRSNPLAESQSLQAGLAQPQTLGPETFLSFSTNPNNVAADNPNGRNSWFTESLADTITKPNLTIDEVFQRVGRQVQSETEQKQIPWVQSNFTGHFYFHPPDNEAHESDLSMAEKWMAEALVHEQREDWPEAIDLVKRILEKKPGPSLEARAKSKLAYLNLRAEAQARFDASDFAAAAKLYEQALTLDPFAIDAAIRSANCYLLSDQIDESLRLFKAVRIRGTAASIAKADSMLKELAAVAPEAGVELKKGLPQPPPIEEMFGDMRFGVPDFDSGKQYSEANPVDLTRAATQLKTDHPMPVAPPPPEPVTLPPVGEPMMNAQITLESLHVEVFSTSGTRDLAIRKLSQPAADDGFVQLEGLSPEAVVLVEGKPVTAKGRVPLPAGKYEVRLVEKGKVLGTQTVEVKALSTIAVTVSRQLP